MPITLYDLAGADPRLRFCPYCWRSTMALAHKDLPTRTVAWRLSERAALQAATGSTQVPAMLDGDTAVHDSWAIAEYLETVYSERPSLFEGAGGLAHARFINAWADTVMIPAITRLLARDVWQMLSPEDRPHFRRTREARLGATLESLAAGRDTEVVRFRHALEPLRRVLCRQEWLGGASPSYADYIVFGGLQSARCVSRFALLAADDPLHEWTGKVMDLFDGLARDTLTCSDLAA